jgi:geranylgeranyl diphosphate synthase type II
MHDFTLVHDDIMDNAPSRRGRPAVHVKWNLNNALLVGDTLLGLAYRSLLRTGRANAHRLSGLFTAALIDVCRGQGLDLEFAEGENVTVRDYFTMIAKKTGRLIATATELGGIIGGGSPTHIAALRRFGHYLGRAFQLQDDLLDVVADQNDLGKPIGGDILEGKRTFLLLRAAERARGADRQLIRRVLARRQAQSTAAARQRTIADVTEVYRRYGVIEETRSLILRNTRKATAALAPLPPSRARDMLLWFADRLVHRTS